MIRKIYAAVIAAFITSFVCAQPETRSFETLGFYLRGDQVMYAKRGYVTDLKSDQVLGNGSRLTTKGMVSKSDGTTFNFEPGVLYSFDAEKTGTVTEYITVKNAVCVIMTNEIATPVEVYKFENGETIDKAGKFSADNSHLKEGEKLSLSGQRIR